jgi:plastocyanin
MNPMPLNRLRLGAAAAILTLAASCSGEKAPEPSAPPAGARRVDASKAGSVAGRVVLEGPVPANPPIEMNADPFCAREHPNGATLENFVAGNGGLENVFVYLKDGLNNYYFEVPTEPVQLDQRACRYVPHVSGIRVGQPLLISNSDETLHTVHAQGEVNGQFNLSQAMKNLTNTRTFTRPEVMIPFKCNVHNWMHAYVGVLDHPYFAVTHDGGKFELPNLPAGTYTVEAWHEKLGAQTQSVTLGEKESKEMTFTFKAGTDGL